MHCAENSPQLNSQAPHYLPPGALLGEICLWHERNALACSCDTQRCPCHRATMNSSDPILLRSYVKCHSNSSFVPLHGITHSKQIEYGVNPVLAHIQPSPSSSNLEFIFNPLLSTSWLPAALTSSAGHRCLKATNTRLHRFTKAGNAG